MFEGLKKRARNWITKALDLAPPSSGRWITVHDSYPGAWGMDVSETDTSVLRYSTVFRAIGLISGDIAKCRMRLIELVSGVWMESANRAYSPLLRRPNSFQTRIEFFAYWIVSLLLTGNTYVMLRRDGAGRVVSMTVLDPFSVDPLVSPSGEVFYRIKGGDRLVGLAEAEEVTLPATYIVHDKYLCLNHPLIGCSPLQVAGAAATASMKVNEYDKSFYTNQARPSGYIEAPEGITEAQATAIKTTWNSYTSTNAGKVAVLENGLKFVPMGVNAQDAQMIEALNFKQQDIARAFGVPAWKLGVGEMPTANNAEISNQHYYSHTLQVRFEAIEQLLDHALGLTDRGDLGVEFNIDDLLRLDSLSLTKMLVDEVKGGIRSPNEARALRGLGPVAGGNTPYLQQQNFSLEALGKRDAKDDPFAAAPKPPAKNPAGEGDETETEDEAAPEESMT